MEAVPSSRCPVGKRHGTGASTVKHVCEDGPAVSALPVRAQLGELPRRKAARDALKCGRIVGKNRKCSHRRGWWAVWDGGDAGRTLPGVFVTGGVYSCSIAGVVCACGRACAGLPTACNIGGDGIGGCDMALGRKNIFCTWGVFHNDAHAAGTHTGDYRTT